MEGAFVRFFPTEGMTADDITQIRLDLYAAGARVVRTMPRPAARLVPANAKGRAAAKQGTTPRQRVAQWVDGLNVEYADDLRAMLDDALSSAGL